MSAQLLPLIQQYKSDKESVYNTWFVNNEDRLKAFRSIRRGMRQVFEDIRSGTFPNDFRGSSLEFVLNCITEQKQVFEGAAHPFYWKPKLRIPDIYENQNKSDCSAGSWSNVMEPGPKTICCGKLSSSTPIKLKDWDRL
ncbi:hypothetical protein [Flaviaesturariibacter amylovorans]|uniref:Uncharacterized protein n=1 Tax=Flaviaesturariibacter amylovorans TaxID=1084520 RepID=A0ABP8HLK1_9BACT